MTDYGRGGVLGAATILPATGIAGLLFLDTTYPIVIAGFIAASCLSLMILLGYISRYLTNRR